MLGFAPMEAPATSPEPAKQAHLSAKEAHPSMMVRACVALRLFALAAALAAAAVLLVEYTNAGDPAFCGVTSGCFAVRTSAYSHIGPVPLPHIAIVAFAVVLGAALMGKTAVFQRATAAMTILGGGGAIVLIGIQAFVIHHFCKWCIIVDTSAIVAALASIPIVLWLRGSEERAAGIALAGPMTAVWGLAGSAAIALPFLWARYPDSPPLPPEIEALQAPGKVTIVAFTDFECPFCRALHPTLDAVVNEHADKVVMRRMMSPLSSHPNARHAAALFLCAPEAERASLAEALYEMEPSEFSPSKLAAYGEKRGYGPAIVLKTCFGDSGTQAEIDRTRETFKRIGGSGLPYTFIGKRVVIGLNPDRVRASVEAQLSGNALVLPTWALIALLGAAFAGAAAMTALRARATSSAV